MVKQLQMRTKPCSPFNVTVENGEKLNCSSTTGLITWLMADKEFTGDFNIIPLGGYDLTLGVKWMAEVSPVTFDYHQDNISVHWKSSSQQECK